MTTGAFGLEMRGVNPVAKMTDDGRKIRWVALTQNDLELNPLDHGSVSHCPYHPFYVCAITRSMVNGMYGSVSNANGPVLMGFIAIDHSKVSTHTAAPPRPP